MGILKLNPRDQLPGALAAYAGGIDPAESSAQLACRVVGGGGQRITGGRIRIKQPVEYVEELGPDFNTDALAEAETAREA